MIQEVQQMIGKFEQVNLRDVWSTEPLLTRWLFDNLDILGDRLGLELSPIETEQPVGPFAADILAEDSAGRPVIIENQLEKTDHDHLGKLLTYLSNLEARVAIWISNNPRPEHTNAINYLNEVVPDDTAFYLVRLEAFRIGDSEPAPMFTVAAGPSAEAKAGGKIKKELAGIEPKRYDFFAQLLERSNTRTSLFANVSPVGYQNWLWAGAGKSGLAWTYVVRKNDARVELYMYPGSTELAKAQFDHFRANREEIEAVFGEPLEWNYIEGRKQHYVRSEATKGGGLAEEDKWAELHDDMVERMIRLEKALKPHIATLT
jgi:hypothetical protein